MRIAKEAMRQFQFNYLRIPCGALSKHSNFEARLFDSFEKTSAEEHICKDDESKNV